jgi:hypothetical protein
MITDDIVYYKKKYIQMCMGEMIPIPKLSRDFEAPVREV